MDGSSPRGMESTAMLNPLLPEAAPLRCCHLRIQPDLVTVVVESVGPAAVCPNCGQPSGRVHSRYTRTLGDLPWQGRVVRWLLGSRRFFCDRAACGRRIFTERLPDAAAPYARKTGRLEQALDMKRSKRSTSTTTRSNQRSARKVFTGKTRIPAGAEMGARSRPGTLTSELVP